MKCPKCNSETFKVTVIRKRKIKFPTLPYFFPVRLTCSKCGKNISAYLVHEDLKIITNRLEEILQRVARIEASIYLKTIRTKKKRFSWLTR